MFRFSCKRLWVFSVSHHSSLKLLSTSSSQSSSSFIVDYLVNQCQLPIKAANSVAKGLPLEKANKKQFDSVLAVLDSLGFSRAEIKRLIVRRPAVLMYQAQTILKPKIQFFQNQGYSLQLISSAILSNPDVMSRSLSIHIKPTLNALKEIIGTECGVKDAIQRSRGCILGDLKQSVLPNVAVLLNESLPATDIAALIRDYPYVILKKPVGFARRVERLKGLGIPPKSAIFPWAIKSKISLDTLHNKLKIFQSLGFSEAEVMEIFKKAPLMFRRSQEKIMKAIDFVMNAMKCDPKDLLKYPSVVSYEMETRMIPRFAVLQQLKSKEVVHADKKCLYIFAMAEDAFLDRFINRFTDRVPDLLEIYQRAKLDGLEQISHLSKKNTKVIRDQDAESGK